jgi:hypothetical protein
MEFAFGVLKWTPDTFWNASMPELMCALNGWKKANRPQTKSSMDREQYIKMRDRVEKKLEENKHKKKTYVKDIKEIRKGLMS